MSTVLRCWGQCLSRRPRPELTLFERAAVIAWWLSHGEPLTPHILAQVHGMPVRVAGELLDRVACLMAGPQMPGNGLDRTVYIVKRLAFGETLTTMDVARAYGTSRQTAYNTMIRIARVVPVYQDGLRWQVCALGEMT